MYCYKCQNYRTNSWDKLYTHLRCRCLNTKEKSLLVNSYVHVQAKREQASQSAGPSVAYGRRWTHLPPATAVSPRTSVSYCLVLTSSTRPRRNIVSRSPRRGSARCRYEGGLPAWVMSRLSDTQLSLRSCLCCEKVLAFRFPNADVVHVNGCESHAVTLF